MKKTGRKNGDNMPVLIEKIIRIERGESNAFIRIQQKRIQQLKEIEQRKLAGRRIQKGRIIKELQASGILDENGNLSKYYFEQDKK